MPEDTARLAEIRAAAIRDDNALSCGQLDEWDVPALRDVCFLLDQITERDKRIAALTAERDDLQILVDELTERDES